MIGTIRTYIIYFHYDIFVKIYAVEWTKCLYKIIFGDQKNSSLQSIGLIMREFSFKSVNRKSFFIIKRHLKSRGAGIYERSGSLNGRPLYHQVEGGGPNSANYIYFNGNEYVIGEQRDNFGFLYQAEGYRRLFMRTHQTEATLENGSKSTCPSDLKEWAIRIPFSTIWSYGSSAISCEEGSYSQVIEINYIITIYNDIILF